jgi:hypothetical protein
MRLHPRLPSRAALLTFVVLSACAAIAYLVCPARLTASNDGLIIDCGRPYAVLLGVAALGLLAAALLTPDRRVRWVGVGLTLLAGVALLEILSYRVTAGRDDLRLRRAFVRARLPWRQLAHSQPAGSALSITGTVGRTLRVELARLSTEQRAALERAIARRVWESGPTVR